MNKIKSIVTVAAFVILLFSLSALCCFSPDKEYTDSERRALAQLPELSWESVKNGEFMESFEEYATDQFPFRDSFRSLKASFSTFCLNKLDNNGLYLADGHISKIDDKKNEYMLNYSADLFRKVYETNIKGKNANVYFSIVPDKNYFLAEINGYPSLDYADINKTMEEKTSDFMAFIPIGAYLSADDYYRTDSHWKQENITDVAKALAAEMGTDVSADYTVNTLDNPFYGVYSGQSALHVNPDEIKYLTNDTLNNCTVTYYGEGTPQTGDMYNMEKAFGKDPYEMFLSGTMPLVTIENPDAKSDKELVMLRDSFAGSLAPLMAGGYKKITLVDLRYIQSGFIGNFIDFENCDVLFIYSTTLLNNSLSMK